MMCNLLILNGADNRVELYDSSHYEFVAPIITICFEASINRIH